MNNQRPLPRYSTLTTHTTKSYCRRLLTNMTLQPCASQKQNSQRQTTRNQNGKQTIKHTHTHLHTQSSIEPKIFPDIVIIIIIIIIPSTTFSCLPLFPFNIDSIGVRWSPWSDKKHHTWAEITRQVASSAVKDIMPLSFISVRTKFDSELHAVCDPSTLELSLYSPPFSCVSLPLSLSARYLRSREARRCVTAAAVTEHVLRLATAAVRDRGGSNRTGRTSAWFLP
jgi:hypothetical protein